MIILPDARVQDSPSFVERPMQHSGHEGAAPPSPPPQQRSRTVSSMEQPLPDHDKFEG